MIRDQKSDGKSKIKDVMETQRSSMCLMIKDQSYVERSKINNVLLTGPCRFAPPARPPIPNCSAPTVPGPPVVACCAATPLNNYISSIRECTVWYPHSITCFIIIFVYLPYLQYIMILLFYIFVMELTFPAAGQCPVAPHRNQVVRCCLAHIGLGADRILVLIPLKVGPNGQ